MVSWVVVVIDGVRTGEQLRRVVFQSGLWLSLVFIGGFEEGADVGGLFGERDAHDLIIRDGHRCH